ncbi:MFS transporter [Embleya scabrispora]|uniref:MFS transporter n=1 Tax=Embleya scabrispora TaxID=159449 RepID=UPI00037C2842|nr:MFS transporter [Embleya scabrispora]
MGELVRASGGPRYAVALGVDALGSGMLRPFLLLYGVQVLGLGVARAGTAMSIGMLLGLATVPFLGRWIDRGARSAPVAGAMLIRVLGVAALLLTGAGVGGSAVWGFTVAALFLGIGDQCWPPAHAALVGTVADERYRDAALAAGRSLRNAGLGAGALIATLTMTGGTGALRVLATVTGLGYTVAALLVRSMRVTGTGRPGSRGAAEPAADRRVADTRVGGKGARGERTGGKRTGGRIGVLDVANLPYAFCFNVLEVALPAVLVTQLHASPAWSAGIFVANTLIVVTTQIAVVVWLSRRPRRSAPAGAGLVLGVSYLGFWAAGGLGGQAGAAAIALVSVLYTAGEIMYTGSATALIVATTPAHRLGRALARFQLGHGIGMAASPAVLTALFAWGPGVLWASLTATTLTAAAAIHRWAPDDRTPASGTRANPVRVARPPTP